MYETTTENGKYRFVNDGGVPKVYCNGQLQEQGSATWLTLLQKVERYERIIARCRCEECGHELEDSLINGGSEILCKDCNEGQ